MVVPVPKGLNYLPYQLDGIAFAASRNACLIGDEMGLGKTVQAIGTCNTKQPNTVLICCPASLKINWAREWKTWSTQTHLSVGIAQGRKNWPDTDVVICNYEIVHWHRERIRRKQWGAVILDECHMLANRTAKRTKALFGRGGHGAVKTDRKIALSGTPLRNRPKELWAVLNWLQPKQWGAWREYTYRYCNAHAEYIYIKGVRKRIDNVDGSSNETEFRNRLYDGLMIRRLKEDVLTDLPPKVRQVIPVDVDAKRMLQTERAMYDRLIGKDVSVDEILNLMILNQDSADELMDVRQQIALKKVVKVVTHVEELLLETDKVVVFAFHRSVIAELMKEFGSQAVQLHGGTSTKDRQLAVDRFQTDPSVRVFVGQIKAAGTGLTLTAASTVVFAELDWVPSDVSQAEDRCHRIGQKDTVVVQHLVAQDSIDVDIAERLIIKQKTIDSCIEGGANEVVEKPRVEVQVNPKETKRNKTMIEYVTKFFSLMERGVVALETIAKAEPVAVPAVTCGTAPAEEPPAEAKPKRTRKKKAEPKAEPVREETPAEPTETPEPEAPEAPAEPVREVSSEDLRAAAVALVTQYTNAGQTVEGARNRAMDVIKDACPEFGGKMADVPKESYPAVLDALTGALDG